MKNHHITIHHHRPLCSPSQCSRLLLPTKAKIYVTCIVFYLLIATTNASSTCLGFFKHVRPARWDTEDASEMASGSSSSSEKEGVAVASYRNEYQDDEVTTKTLSSSSSSSSSPKKRGFRFPRHASPLAIQRALRTLTNSKSSSFQRHRGSDGREGMVSCTQLGGDWVLAQSKQIARNCTSSEVLRAYLNGDLQTKWNAKQVKQCTFEKVNQNSVNDNTHSSSSSSSSSTMEPFYLQDLVLHSQRIILSHTGIMRYRQTITIDKIGHEGNYCVGVNLDPTTATRLRPFNALSVYVGLQQNGPNVEIYAAGFMKVNRKVVPNLLVFDASGIAGSMAGKGTLWLAAHFQRKSQLE